MKEIIAYEMIYNKALKYQNDIICVPFQKEYWNEYMKIYNECPLGKLHLWSGAPMERLLPAGVLL